MAAQFELFESNVEALCIWFSMPNLLAQLTYEHFSAADAKSCA